MTITKVKQYDLSNLKDEALKRAIAYAREYFEDHLNEMLFKSESDFFISGDNGWIKEMKSLSGMIDADHFIFDFVRRDCYFEDVSEDTCEVDIDQLKKGYPQMIKWVYGLLGTNDVYISLNDYNNPDSYLYVYLNKRVNHRNKNQYHYIIDVLTELDKCPVVHIEREPKINTEEHSSFSYGGRLSTSTHVTFSMSFKIFLKDAVYFKDKDGIDPEVFKDLQNDFEDYFGKFMCVDDLNSIEDYGKYIEEEGIDNLEIDQNWEHFDPDYYVEFNGKYYDVMDVTDMECIMEMKEIGKGISANHFSSMCYNNVLSFINNNYKTLVEDNPYGYNDDQLVSWIKEELDCREEIMVFDKDGTNMQVIDK